MSEEWGPWIIHDGGPRPIPLGTYCQREYISRIDPCRPPEIVEGPLGQNADGLTGYSWLAHPPVRCRYIYRYRIRKPRGLTILEEQLRDIPEQVDA